MPKFLLAALAVSLLSGCAATSEYGMCSDLGICPDECSKGDDDCEEAAAAKKSRGSDAGITNDTGSSSGDN